MNKLLLYFKESWQEIGKITWPSRKVAIRLTFAVIIFSLIFATFFGLADVGLSELFKRLILKA